MFLGRLSYCPYEYARSEQSEPYRDRKLLLHKKQIERLSIQVNQKGLTIVPLKVYFNSRGRAKLEIGLGKGKKLFDKRRDIKERDIKRQLDRLARN